MQRKFIPILALVMAGMFSASPVFAERHGKHRQQWPQEEQRLDVREETHNRGGYERPVERYEEHNEGPRHRYFDEHQRTVVREYYVERYHAGHCPPGLVRGEGGCRPYRHNRGWSVGQPLPRSVVRYELPPRVVVNLGTPPAGHKFVRVASDILLVAVGTGLIVDAIQDLDGL